MSIMDGLISVVKTASPLLATALGSPIAGIALSLLGNLFGTTSKNPDEILKLIKNDPDFEIRIKKLEFDHIEELSRIASTDYQTEVEDRKDARKMFETEQEDYKNFMRYMAFLVTIGFFGTLFLCFSPAIQIHDEEKQILLVFIGVLVSKWQTIIDFFFGSSKK